MPGASAIGVGRYNLRPAGSTAAAILGAWSAVRQLSGFLDLNTICIRLRHELLDVTFASLKDKDAESERTLKSASARPPAELPHVGAPS